jgi:DNA-binding CsgD family transcriptional regulator
VLGREHAYRQGAYALVELLRLIDPSKPDFAEHRACATETLAMRARELYLPDVVPEVERHLDGVPWPPALCINRFQATKALGWAKALQGDYFNAFRHLKESARLAPTDAWRTMAHCDRAYLASSLGEQRWARQELHEAEELAARVVWETCREQEPVALLLMAELFAPIDAARASAYMATFRKVGDGSAARHLMTDDRMRALAEFSSGIVDHALGNRKLAATRLQNALQVYQTIGYDWRAGRCALRLFDVTRRPEFVATAQEHLRHYMSCWLGDELRARLGPARSGPDLPPMQARIFKLMCEGRSNEEMAGIVRRSKATVANHAKAVLKAFGVSTRPSLIAEAMKRGLLS